MVAVVRASRKMRTKGKAKNDTRTTESLSKSVASFVVRRFSFGCNYSPANSLRHFHSAFYYPPINLWFTIEELTKKCNNTSGQTHPGSSPACTIPKSDKNCYSKSIFSLFAPLTSSCTPFNILTIVGKIAPDLQHNSSTERTLENVQSCVPERTAAN